MDQQNPDSILSMIRGRLINRFRGMVRCRCSMVGWLGCMIFWFTWFSTVWNISYITTVSVNSVFYSLDTTIGKSNMIFATCGITISFFICSKINISVVISNGIGIFICCREIFIFGFMVGWCRGMVLGRGMVRGRGRMLWSRSWGLISQSNGSQGKNNKYLLKIIYKQYILQK